MSKPVYVASDNTDALNTDALAEEALRAQQAEANSSGRAASPVAPTSAAVATGVASTAVAGPAATPASAAAAAASATQTVISHAMGPLNAAKALSDAPVATDSAAHGYSAVEVASASAIMQSDLKGGPLAKLDTQLAALYLEHSSEASATAPATSAVQQFANTIFTDSAGHQYVTIDAHAADGDGAALLTELESLGSGFKNGASFEGIASGQIAVGELGSLLHMTDLGNVHESGHITNVGLVTSQAVQAEAVDTAANEYGLDGSGLKIGVLSDSFDAVGSVGINGQPDTMATDIASGDLPANTTILQDYAGGANEGRGMAQLIHDIAPGAAIEFATAFDGQAGFASNIEQLAADGSKEIVDDVTYFNEPAFQNGIIAQAVNDVVTKDNVTYFSSAGNNFDAGWTGASHFESTAVSTASLFGNLNGAPNETIQLQQFASGEDYIPLSDPIGVAEGYSGFHYISPDFLEVQWNDPDSNSSGSGYGGSGGTPGPASDLDLFVYDATKGKVIAYSTDDNITSGDPIEVVSMQPTIGDDIRVYVGAYALGAAPPTEIKVLNLGDGLPFVLGDAKTNATAQTFETSIGHNAAPDAITVAAASYTETPAYGALTPLNEYYSSDGAGVTLYYDDNGNRLATPEVLHKVDLTAVDNVDTTFFGYDSDANGFPNFSGTSAAAPDAAAVGLLLLQADPSLTPADIRHLEMDSAIPMPDISGSADVGGTTPSTFTLSYNGAAGAGLVQADVAAGFAEGGAIQNDAQDALYGTSVADTIIAGPGSVVVEGFGGADTLIAGAGADTFVYSDVSDSSSTAYDTIHGFKTGTDAVDLRAVDNGQVSLFQQADGSTYVMYDLAGGQFQGKIYSTDAVNVRDVFVNPGTVVTDYGSPDGGFLRGGPNEDVLIARGGATTLYGALGGDLMYAAATGVDTFQYKGAGASNLKTATSYDTIYDFKVGIDKIDLTQTGTDSVVVAHHDGGSSIYFDPDSANTAGDGYDGFIDVSGASLQAKDIIAPGAQIILEGGSGGDTLVGGVGNDVLIAGSGSQTLIGGGGQDAMYAGSGADTFVINGPQDSSMAAPDSIFDFKSGTDKIDLSGAAGVLDFLEFSYDASGDTTLNFVSNGNNVFYGSVNVLGTQLQVGDVLTGTANPYVDLDGSSVADTLTAGAQNTTFYGSGGADTLNAGSGTDTFLYSLLSDSTTTAYDTINGFKTGTDKIDISAVDGGGVALNYNSGGTFVEYAPDGNGNFQGEIFVAGVAVQGSDLIASLHSTTSVDAASTDLVAAQAAELAILNMHTASVFGH